MTIEIINGCLLDALDRGDVNVAVHCVNLQKVMGSGIALSIKNRYPKVYNQYINHTGYLGEADWVMVYPKKDLELYPRCLVNLYGQEDYGMHKRQGNYGAISNALSSIRKGLHYYYGSMATIGFPYKMCSDRAGCDFDIILEMIEFYFKGLPVKIYKL